MRFGELLKLYQIPQWTSFYLDYHKLKRLVHKEAEIVEKTLPAIFGGRLPDSYLCALKSDNEIFSFELDAVTITVEGQTYEFSVEHDDIFLAEGDSEKEEVERKLTPCQQSPGVPHPKGSGDPYTVEVVSEGDDEDFDQCEPFQHENTYPGEAKNDNENKNKKLVQCPPGIPCGEDEADEDSEGPSPFHRIPSVCFASASTIQEKRKLQLMGFVKLLEQMNKNVGHQFRREYEKVCAFYRHTAQLLCGIVLTCVDASKRHDSLTEKARDSLAQRIRQTFEVIHQLQDFCDMNSTAMAKFLKKFAKQTHQQTLSAYNDLLQSQQGFPRGRNSRLQLIANDLSNAYLHSFTPANRKKGMRFLMVQDRVETVQHRIPVIVAASFLGGIVTLFFALIIMEYYNIQQPMQDTHDTFYWVSLTFLTMALPLGFGFCIMIWEKLSINFIFILGMEAEVTGVKILAQNMVYLLWWMACTFAYLRTYFEEKTCSGGSDSKIQYWVWPYLIPIFFLLTKVVSSIVKRISRHVLPGEWLLVAIGRILLTPLFEVTFADFFITDQFTSIAGLFFEWQFFWCYIGADEEVGERCHDAKGSMHIFGLAILPVVWRMLQSCRKWYDEPQRMKHYFPHLANATKYTIQTLSVLSSFGVALAKHYKASDGVKDFTLAMWFIIHILSLLISASWDTIMDFGLLIVTKKYVVVDNASDGGQNKSDKNAMRLSETTSITAPSNASETTTQEATQAEGENAAAQKKNPSSSQQSQTLTSSGDGQSKGEQDIEMTSLKPTVTFALADNEDSASGGMQREKSSAAMLRSQMSLVPDVYCRSKETSKGKMGSLQFNIEPRSEFSFPPWVHYAHAAINVLLRCAWIAKYIVKKETSHHQWYFVMFACFDILRRFLWTIFRVEHESFHNIEGYRATKIIPLPGSVAREQGTKLEESPEEISQRCSNDAEIYHGIKAGNFTSITRFFALLPDVVKLSVMKSLSEAGHSHIDAHGFQGVHREGKSKIFSELPEEIKLHAILQLLGEKTVKEYGANVNHPDLKIEGAVLEGHYAPSATGTATGSTTLHQRKTKLHQEK